MAKRDNPIAESWAFRNRGVLGVLLFLPALVAVLLGEPLVAETSAAGLTMDLAGWVFFLLYVTFRLWATLYIGGKKDSQLQTRGPYAMTRNPLYFGSLCFVVSFAFLFKSPLLLLMTVLIATFYLRAVIPAEERVLEQNFGNAFLQWARVTPRLFPSLSLLSAEQTVEVSVRALRKEGRRLWWASLLPLVALLISFLRAAPWWPHLHAFPI